MPDKIARGQNHYLKELEDMVKEGKMPKEKVLAVFCQRHGIPMDKCKKLYDELAKKEKTEET